MTTFENLCAPGTSIKKILFDEVLSDHDLLYCIFDFIINNETLEPKNFFQQNPEIRLNSILYNKVIKYFKNKSIKNLIRHVPEEYIDRKIVIEGLNKNPLWYQYIPNKFKSDVGIINLVLNKNYKVFDYFPSNIKKKWIKTAMENNINVITYIKNDDIDFDVLELIQELINKDLNNFKFLSEEVEKNACVLNHTEEKLINKLDSKGVHHLKKITDTILSNKNIILNIAPLYPTSLNFISDELKNDKDIVLAAVQKYGNTYKFASLKMKNDVDVIISSYLSSNNFFHYYSEKSKSIIKFHFDLVFRKLLTTIITVMLIMYFF